MKFIEMKDYDWRARAYWWVTTAAGASALLWALAGVSHFQRFEILELGGLVAVVYLAGLHPFRLQGTHTVITISDVFVFLSALYLGAPAATIVAASDALTVSCRESKRWTSRIGGPAISSISIFVSAAVFQRAVEWLRTSHLLWSSTLLAAVLLFSIQYFALNSFLLATSYALKQRKPIRELWWTNYAWIVLTSLASASAAGLIYLAVQHYGVSSLLAAVPFIAVIYATCYFYSRQAGERTKASERISRLHLATVEALATAIDAKDQVTHDHVYRVQVYACGLARLFGLSDLEVEALKAGALLHDVGKIAVPDHILNKPGKLTAAEFDKMKIHTIVGAQILDRVGFPYPVVPIVRHHHERWDGEGYPDGLAGTQIPMTARILTVVDCFDAVREDRQYRKAMSRDQAIEFLRENAGKQFDPEVVSVFVTHLPGFEREIEEHKASHQQHHLASTQPGLSEGGRAAKPAAGLAPSEAAAPEYVKHIKAAHSEVAALYEMAQTFSGSHDVRDVATLIADRLERLIPFTTCVVYLRQPDDSAAASHVFGLNAGQIRGRSLAAGRGIAGWVVINGRPMSNTDPMLDLNEFLGTNESGYKAVAIYPLLKGSDAIGALALYSAEMASYTGDHLRLLESVSQFASTALQHAMLYERAQSSAAVGSATGSDGRDLYARLDQSLHQALAARDTVSVLCFGVEGLREVNESFGYRVGDRMLAEVGNVLRQHIEPNSFLGQTAGGEFLCVLRARTRPEALALAEKVHVEAGKIGLEMRANQTLRIGLSFGIADTSRDGTTADELLGSAASAMQSERKHAKPSELPQREAGYFPVPSLDLESTERCEYKM